MQQTRIVFCNGKGGVGKTTCAVMFANALAQTSMNVAIEDRDPQRSATTAAAIFGLSLDTANAQFVVVDTAPNLTSPAFDPVTNLQMPDTIDAIRTADLLVLVTSPSPLDVATTSVTANRIMAEKRAGEARLLFNLVQTNNRFFDQMPEIGKDIPFPVCKSFLTRRTAYQLAQIQGWKSLPRECREEVLHFSIELFHAIPRIVPA